MRKLQFGASPTGKNFFCIENEYELPNDIELFCNLNTNLVNTLDVTYGALDADMSDLVEDIRCSDALIVESTFMYVHQLEKIVHAMVHSDILKDGYEIYVMRLTMHIKEWKKSKWSFKDYELFMLNLAILLKNYKVYSIDTTDFSFTQVEADFLLLDDESSL